MSEGQSNTNDIPCSYQLQIALAKPQQIQIGRLGCFYFPAGLYIYTGSAKRNLEARIKRHQSTNKKLHWHIDYLLNSPHAHITAISRSSLPECPLNLHTPGTVPVPGFGASDCQAGCNSHLKLNRAGSHYSFFKFCNVVLDKGISIK